MSYIVGSGYTLIEKIVLGGTGAITFSNIPQNFNHLVVQLLVRCSKAATSETGIMRFNGDTGTNYSMEYLLANGGATAIVGSGPATNAYGFIGNITASTATANYAAHIQVYIPFYSQTNFKKTANIFSSGFQFSQFGVLVFQWDNTAAITSITTTGNSGGYLINSSATLHGIT